MSSYDYYHKNHLTPSYMHMLIVVRKYVTWYILEININRLNQSFSNHHFSMFLIYIQEPFLTLLFSYSEVNFDENTVWSVFCVFNSYQFCMYICLSQHVDISRKTCLLVCLFVNKISGIFLYSKKSSISFLSSIYIIWRMYFLSLYLCGVCRFVCTFKYSCKVKTYCFYI